MYGCYDVHILRYHLVNRYQLDGLIFGRCEVIWLQYPGSRPHPKYGYGSRLVESRDGGCYDRWEEESWQKC
jgi:hypothetical protein